MLKAKTYNNNFFKSLHNNSVYYFNYKFIIITSASWSGLSDRAEQLFSRRPWLSLEDYCTCHVGTLEPHDARWPTTRFDKHNACKNQTVVGTVHCKKLCAKIR